ncbi:TIGR03086 family metal-binding protein [Rhodococcus gannanensis]|uniref:TIGR03086 family metal-binding protein n=1 Tax=Rhodococcus gannanensis TaxID=1960308 RepID=A0ABW4P3A9_9NOCA
MPVELDLAPAAAQVSTIAANVRDDQLAAPTPCTKWPVTVLLAHLVYLSEAFTAAGRKTPFPGDASVIPELPADWRTRLAANLDTLVAAWRDPGAWEGEATAGGVTMPASVMGVVALDELVLHGWDLARATGQPFAAEPADVLACLGFAEAMSQPGDEASREGLYGPVVPVPADTDDLTRLLGYAGRSAAWPDQ